MITEKQNNYIVYLLSSDDEFRRLFLAVPERNKKYNNPKCDFRKMILAEILDQKLIVREAKYLINPEWIK